MIGVIYVTFLYLPPLAKSGRVDKSAGQGRVPALCSRWRETTNQSRNVIEMLLCVIGPVHRRVIPYERLHRHLTCHWQQLVGPEHFRKRRGTCPLLSLRAA